MLLTTKKWVKSILKIVTLLQINNLHPGEMLLGTDPEMSGAAGPPPACGAMMGAAEMGAGGRGRRTRGHPDGLGVIQTYTGASRRTRGHPDGLGVIQAGTGTKKTSRETRVFRDV